MRDLIFVRFQVLSVFASVRARQLLGANRWIAVGVKIAERTSEAHVYMGEFPFKVFLCEAQDTAGKLPAESIGYRFWLFDRTKGVLKFRQSWILL